MLPSDVQLPFRSGLSSMASPRVQMYCSEAAHEWRDSSCHDVMLRVGSSSASGIGCTLLPVPADCAETEIGIRQRASNVSRTLTGNLPARSIFDC